MVLAMNGEEEQHEESYAAFNPETQDCRFYQTP